MPDVFRLDLTSFMALTKPALKENIMVFPMSPIQESKFFTFYCA